MGPRQQRHAKRFYAGVNSEERLASEHPPRRHAATVNFAFVRSQVAKRHVVRGHRSLDPTLILKLLFPLFYEIVASERQRLRERPCRLDGLWFLERDLDSPVSDLRPRPRRYRTRNKKGIA